MARVPELRRWSEDVNWRSTTLEPKLLSTILQQVNGHKMEGVGMRDLRCAGNPRSGHLLAGQWAKFRRGRAFELGLDR